jgi:hypothetical protein
MSQPPLLPDIALGRVLRLARFDGGGALIIGGMFALMTASKGDSAFALIGLAAAGVGAIELHGAALLRQGRARGMRWLILSQPLLLGVIWSYCLLRLTLLPLPPIPEAMQPLFAASAAQWHMPVDQYLRTLNRITASILAVVALGFQGGTLLYYLRRRKDVERAMVEPWPAPSAHR